MGSLLGCPLSRGFGGCAPKGAMAAARAACIAWGGEAVGEVLDEQALRVELRVDVDVVLVA